MKICTVRMLFEQKKGAVGIRMVKKYPLIQDTETRKDFMFGEEIEIEKK